MSKKGKAVYVCERCGTIISRTLSEVHDLIKRFGAIICRRCDIVRKG